MNFKILGNGSRFENLNNIANGQGEFRAQSSNPTENEDYIIWTGEGEPDPKTHIWIKKTNATVFQDLIDEMKKHFQDMPNLEFVGADNFNYFSISTRMCVLLSRENTILTFSSQDDLDQFILGQIGIVE